MNLSSEFDILPLVSYLMQSIREGKDELQLARVIAGLNEKFLECQRLVDQLLEGTELTREEQERVYREQFLRLRKKK